MRSVGDEIIRLMGRIEHLQLGPYVFKNLLCSFRTSAHEPAPPWAKEGVLGQGILRRFNIVFDYTHEKIILEPNGHFNESFEFNMAGIQFNRAAQDRFQISRVIPDSPASEAGLCAGDLIVQMNGQPASQFSVDDVEQLLKKEGEKLMLYIKRGKELLQLSLILRRLI
jgi:predicted metalloprotease with PDZ domain